jgi:dipeptidyl aminopeptidase/acylaminoacyl peptidase
VARDAAKRGPVVAYGMSAGATLAAALAATGEVDGAVVAGGPTNLLNWICVSPYLTTARFWRDVGMDRNARRLASPVFRLNGHQSPQLLQYGDIDPLVPIDQGLQYFEAAVKGQPDTSFQLMPISPHTYPAAYRVKAREWIQARWPIRPPLRLAR